MRFSSNALTINVGDTVEWSSPTPHSFHNVTFGAEPDVFQLEPQAAGPPKAYASPIIFLPMGGNTYTGPGVYSSGIIQGPADPPATGNATSYSLTFTGAGRFEYVCGLHYHNGMDGNVTVSADRTGALPGMPTTGSGSGWEIPSLAAVLGLVLASFGLVLRRRKSAI
jgi:LPXTG-motif cell wall-anchored protein